MSAKRKSRPRSEPAAPAAASMTGSIGDYIRRQREIANVSLRKLSEQSGISAAVLKEIESGLRHPSKTIVGSIAAGLRLSAETLYLQAGVLDPQSVDESPSVREVRRDPHLTTRQREILVEIYATFRSENRRKREE